MKIKYLLVLIIAGLASCSENVKKVPDQNTAKKILFICTNVDEVNGNKNGTFLSEIAVPFILFEERGLEMDIVSPKGGAIPIYYKFDTTEIISKALHSTYYHQQIHNSLKPSEINYKDYQALVIPGGYGQFWDIHDNDAINKLIAQIYENKGIITTLGHGTAALVNVNLTNDEPLVKGVSMSCFPSWFEKEIMTEADYGKLLPFDMEEELVKRGADLKRVDKETRSNGQIVDSTHKVVTASFGNGGEFIATEVLKLLDK